MSERGVLGSSLLALCAVLSMVLAVLRAMNVGNVDLTVLAFVALALVILVSDRLKELVAGKDGLSVKLAERLDSQERVLQASSAGEVGGPQASATGTALHQVAGRVEERAMNSEILPLVLVPNDPQKGRWGGEQERNGRRLESRVTQVPGLSSFFDVELRVVTTDRSRPLTGNVRFHLHPTFDPVVVEEKADGRSAKLKRIAWGSFTVGAECDGGSTQLELDLSEVPEHPEEFKHR